MRISVVIPLYNKKDTILRALNSVFSQIRQPEEIIVINDGSKDGSEKIVADISHPLIRLISQPNTGVSAARNKGISEAQCEWIAFLDADDEWLPDYLETISRLSDKYPDCSVLATAYYLQNGGGIKEYIILNRLKLESEDGMLSNYFKVAAYSDPPLWSSAVVVRKSALEGIGLFPLGIASGEDLLTWARLAVRYKIAYCNRPLSVFIKDDTAVSRTPEEPDFVGSELIKLMQQHNMPFFRHYISLWHKMRARSYLTLGYKTRAFHEILKSIWFFPLARTWYFLPFVLMNSRVFINASRKYKRALNR